MQTPPPDPRSSPLQPPAAAPIRMIDVSGKPVTVRRARARGTIQLSKQAFVVFQKGTNPKGDVTTIAIVAGITAAKKTAELLPLCHPLPLTHVGVWLEPSEAEQTVTAVCEATAEAQTGVEMEALAGVSGALLAVYDLMKVVDPVMTIGGIRLDFKEGGKAGFWTHPDAAVDPLTTAGGHPQMSTRRVGERSLDGIHVRVVTVSDRVAAGTMADRSGPAVVETLRGLGATVTGCVVVPDDRATIAATLHAAARGEMTDTSEGGCDVIVTTGGTGLGPRDVTPEAVADACDRMAPGLGELVRAAGARGTPHAWLGRATAGMIGRVLVVALPGSENGAREGIVAVAPVLAHAVHVARGGGHAEQDALATGATKGAMDQGVELSRHPPMPSGQPNVDSQPR